MPETVTVAAVSDEPPREWVHRESGNVVHYYKVKFVEHPDRVVEWGVKKKPEVGQTVEGDFKHGQYGWSFKRAKNDSHGGGGGGGKADFRTREQIIMQEADHVAASLVLASAQAGVSIQAVLQDFYKASAAVQERVKGADKPYGTNEVRKDIERTGQSDVPNGWFEPPAQARLNEDDDVPF